MSPVPGQLNRRPFGLVVSGEASRHEEAVRKLLGPGTVVLYRADDTGDILRIIRQEPTDAVVVDREGDEDLLRTLRQIRRVNTALPVVLVARDISRWFLEDALRLAAFSVAHKPLEREELLQQLRLIFQRYGL